jgi:hypothetical protein
MTKPVEESVASDTLKPQNKSQMLGAALAKMAGLDIEDLSHFLNDTLAQVSDKGSSLNGGGAPDASSSNQATLAMKPSAASSAMKESVKSDLSEILSEGEELSEELREKASVLFETAVEARLVIEREALIEEMNQNLEEAFDTMKSEMVEKLDAYLDHIAEAWLKENEVAVESALRTEITENFIAGMRNLFLEHNFNVPEEEVNIAEELAAKNANLEESLDAALTENARLKSEVLESRKQDAVNTVCEGMTLTQAEKLRALCESVEFDGDLDAYTRKVSILAESVTKKASNAPSTGMIVEESDPDAALRGNAPDAGVDPQVKRYIDSISRTIRK